MHYKLGLLGQRISYTLSPRIFEWAFRETGVHGTYSIIDLPEADTAEFFQTQAFGFDGFNVTVPHKSAAAKLVHEFAKDAADAGAVNTIVRTDRVLIGHNTDVDGFTFALGQFSVQNIQSERVLVIGAGGAARAVIVALRRRGVQQITVASRQLESARGRLAEWPQHLAGLITCDKASRRLSEFDLVVQATPVGGANLPGSPLRPDAEFSPRSCVMDVIYAPRETELLRRARDCGAHTMNGLPMLIAQAGVAFELWTNVRFPVDDAMNKLLPELEQA